MGRVVRFVAWCYFNRIALLTLAAIGLLGPVGSGSPLLGNVINMSGNGDRALFLLGLMTVLACGSAVVCINLNNYYGWMRWDVAMFPAGKWVRLGIFGLGCAAGASLVRAVAGNTPGPMARF